MSQKGPGKSYRNGISIMELADKFPDEKSATDWFEAIHWPSGRCCGHCGGTETKGVPNQKPMPYWCKECRSYFSVKTGTPLQASRLPVRKWVFAIYLYVTHLKGVSSMKLHRDLGITQKTAWFMLHRLREAWTDSGLESFIGPVEVDETYIGGKEKNKHGKNKLRVGRGGVGKTAVVGAKDRTTNKIKAQTVANTTGKTLKGFVRDNTTTDALVFTDEHRAYTGLKNHQTVKHSVGEYVREQAHTNGIESFWSMLKRGYHGTYHHMSEKHLNRYVSEFSGRHNHRPLDTIDQMEAMVSGMVGKQLSYQDLIG